MRETVTGKTLVDQTLINDQGLKSFCPGLLHQGVYSYITQFLPSLCYEM